MSDGYLILDGGSQVVQANPAAERILDRATEEIGPDDVTGLAADDLFDRVSYTERNGDYEGEFAVDGGEETRYFSVETADLEDDGFVIGSLLILRDVTERKQRQRELEQQNERLEEFASMVSHDLRNPLNVAREYLGIARRAEDPEQFIDEVETSLDRMEAMIEDVLTLAREGEDVAEPDTVELDLVAEMAWSNCDTKEASLVVEDSFQFTADPDRLLELFENLFRNAVEHGGEAVTVTVGQLDDAEGFFVADDGPGVDDHVKESVFDHGVTTADDGTGFGMAIVDRIAEAHGWEASVRDSEDGGARFDFVFADPLEA